MQQADIAERRDAIVELRSRGKIERTRIGHRQSGGRGSGDGVEEFTAVHGPSVGPDIALTC